MVLASIIRSCVHLGVGELHIISTQWKDWESFRANENLIQLTGGQVRRVYVLLFASTEDYLAHTKRERYDLVAVSPFPSGSREPAIPLRDATLTHSKLAVAFGAENCGISAELISACRSSIKLEMRGFAAFNDVHIHAAIVLHRATEARTVFGMRKQVHVESPNLQVRILQPEDGRKTTRPWRR